MSRIRQSFALSSLFAGFCTALAAAAPSANADAPNVVASIKPVHSLVAGVMGKLGTPHLLVSGADSPHTYAMRPSDAQALSEADLVFWIGPELETFLERPIGNLGDKATSVALIDAPGLILLGFGETDADEHEHDGDHDEDHDAGDHDQDDHDAEDHAGEGHSHQGTDPHVWLDPANARAMVDAIASALATADSENEAAYLANAEALKGRLTQLEADTQTILEPYRNAPYFTFHDSFRYFDARFALDGHGSISVSPERQPGVQRLGEIRDEITAFGQVCIFAEPQFPPKLVNVIVEGTTARTGTLDPLGASLPPGEQLYFELIGANRKAFTDCFG